MSPAEFPIGFFVYLTTINADHSATRSRRPNGATQTFRRSSAAVTSSNPNSVPSRDPPSQSRNSGEAVGPYIPPHRNGTASDLRYTREQLIALYQSQEASGDLGADLSSLYINGWEPEVSNGASGSPWTRREDQKEAQTGADICWDLDGRTRPLGLRELSADEKEVYSFVVVAVPSH
jgi:PERQ amino acid-rich with GYF domain-containing protein